MSSEPTPDQGWVPVRTQLASRARTVLVVGMLVLVVAVAFELYAVVTAMPVVAAELGGFDLYAWAFTAVVVAQVFSIVVAGRLSDRIGPVPPLFGGLTLFVLGLLLAGFAPTMGWLLVARFVQGLGAGALNLALMVVMAEAFAGREQAVLLSALSFCWMLPSFLGPPVAAWLALHWGWPWVFWVIVPIAVVSGLVSAPSLRVLHRLAPSRDVPVNQVPVWAAGLAAVGVLLVQTGGQRFTSPQQGSPIVSLASIAVGMVVLGTSIGRLMPAGFWRVRHGLPALMGSRALQTGSFFAAETFLPLMLADQHGLTLGQAGLTLSIGSAGWALGSWAQAQRWLRLTRDQIVVAGTGCSTVGTAVVATGAWVAGLSPWVIVSGWTLAGFGMGLASASTTLANIALSPAEQLGRNTSSLQVAEGLGNALVVALAGFVFAGLHGRTDAQLSFGWLYVVVTVVAWLSILVSARIGRIRNLSSGVG